MALVFPIKLSDEEKLETLQRLDQFWQWYSLNEKRYCFVCGKIIIGAGNPGDLGAHVKPGRGGSFVRRNVAMRCR
jgi:hypothetical protein